MSWQRNAHDTRVPKSGDIIDGTFRILNRLGGGAAGEVFSAALVREWSGHPEGTIFCLKWYRDDIFKREPSENVVARRVREAIIGGSLSHPNLVKAYDMSELWADAPPRYLVMELLGGETLEEFVKRGPVTTKVARQILLDVAMGLNALHDHNVLHRDIKAANVMVMENHSAVLLDLGVARPESEATMTDTQAFLGTLRFAAPEWLFAEKCDYMSDVYSLGTIAYHLFTGEEIFSSVRLFSRVVEAVRHHKPPFPQTGNDSERQYMMNLTRRMLEKQPRDRPSLEQVIEILSDRDLCHVWMGLHDSELFERMPEYCRSDSEVQRSVVRTIKDVVPWGDFKEIVDGKDYDRLLRHKAVLNAIYPPEVSDLVAYYLALPGNERVAWAVETFHAIGEDDRIQWGAQIEDRCVLMERLSAVEESEERRQQLKPFLDQGKAEMNDLINTIAQENP